MILNKIHGTSLVTTSINSPVEFGINTLTTNDKSLILDENFKFEIDNNNITSIIKFNTIPYIDYSKFDYERRRWFYIDKYGSLWRHYGKGDYVIEEDYVVPKYYKYFSMENLYKNKYPNGIHRAPGYPDELALLESLKLTQYKPISLTIEGVEYTDITDYSFNINPTLDYIAPEKNRQFYLKGSSIYTNTDLTLYEPQDIEITYYYTISEVKVHCQMNTNSANFSNYTPVVDYYVLKLTGQTL